MTTLAACPNVAVKISGLGQPGSVDRRGQPRHRAHHDRPLRRRRAACSPATSRSTACARPSARSSAAFARSCATSRAHEQRALFHDNAIRIYDDRMNARTVLRIGYVGVGPDGPADGRSASSSLGYRGQRLRHRAARKMRGARRPARSVATRRRTRRAMRISCCSTCRPPRRSRTRCSATDGVAAALRRRNSWSTSRPSRSTRASAFAARLREHDRLRLDRCAGVGRAAGVGHRHADRDGRRR